MLHLLYGILAGSGFTGLLAAIIRRIPTREDKQNWWEGEVAGLKDALNTAKLEIRDLRSHLAESDGRISALETERDDALIRLAKTIIQRDDAQNALNQVHNRAAVE